MSVPQEVLQEIYREKVHFIPVEDVNLGIHGKKTSLEQVYKWMAEISDPELSTEAVSKIESPLAVPPTKFYWVGVRDKKFYLNHNKVRHVFDFEYYGRDTLPKLSGVQYIKPRYRRRKRSFIPPSTNQQGNPATNLSRLGPRNTPRNDNQFVNPRHGRDDHRDNAEFHAHEDTGTNDGTASASGQKDGTIAPMSTPEDDDDWIPPADIRIPPMSTSEDVQDTSRTADVGGGKHDDNGSTGGAPEIVQVEEDDEYVHHTTVGKAQILFNEERRTPRASLASFGHSSITLNCSWP